MYASCLLRSSRIGLKKKKLIPITQTGFRAVCGTLTDLTAITLIMEKTTTTEGNLYACFVDFKVAFDGVQRQRLWLKLMKWGIPSSLLNAIIELYSYTSVQVKLRDGSTISRKFNTDTGRKQGCVLTPCLFNLYLVDLPEYLSPEENLAPTLGSLRI